MDRQHRQPPNLFTGVLTRRGRALGRCTTHSLTSVWEKYAVCPILAFLVPLLVIVSVSSSWPSHSVGEPELEKDPSWRNCCADQDCVPQEVKIIGTEWAGEISVKIEGVQTKVNKDKLHAVPSQRTWVCYFDRNGAIANENIRCVLYPEKASTVKIRQWLHNLRVLW